MKRLWLLLVWLPIVSGCGSQAPPEAGPGAHLKGGFAKAGSPDRLRPVERRFVLAIGIDAYPPANGWHPLKFPARDATAVASALEEQGGYTVVQQLTGALTRAQIVAALDALDAQVQRPSDVAIVYISGHGTLGRDPGGELARYLVPSDGRITDVPGTALAVKVIKDRFGRLASQRKVLILATCHSGSGKSNLPAPLLSELRTYKSAFFPAPLETVSRASVLIGASGWGEPAREDPALGHDIYTYYLLEAIRRGYDPDQDGATTISEAHDYARRLTWRRSGGRQRPSLQSDILGADPIVLAGRVSQPAMPLLLSFNPMLNGVSVVVDGQTKGELPGNIVVPPGAHRVQLRRRGGRIIGDADVDLAAGGRVVLDDLVQGLDAGPRWSLGLGVGYQAFLDSQSRAELVQPLVLPRLRISRDAPSWQGFVEATGTLSDSESDATLRSASGVQSQVPYRLAQYSLGVGARFDVLTWRGLVLGVGPVLNGVYFQRRLALLGAPDEESYFGVAPAIEAGARLRLSRRLFVNAGGRASYLAFQVDSAWRHIALADLWLGTGVTF